MPSIQSIIPPLKYTQNFLKDTKLVQKLVDQTDISPGTTVLEIGAGKGIITAALANKVSPSGRIIAIELDNKLFAQLQQIFLASKNITIVNQDILEFDFGSLGAEYMVFSNLPFAITAKVFEKLFTVKTGPQKAWLILQKQAVLDTNRGGKPNQTFKSLLLQPLYEIELVHEFSRSDFIPQPQADTALFEFRRRSLPLIDTRPYPLYQDFLAYISHDRVGEGAWLKLASKKQITAIARASKLQVGKGLKSQNTPNLLAAFAALQALAPSSLAKVHGALKKLRAEQDRHEQITTAGGFHRSRPSKRR